MSSSIQRITYRSLDRFPETTDDERNRSKTDRTFELYIEIFNRIAPEEFHVTKFLKDRFISVQRKMFVLDCGAGKGVALNSLLNSEYGTQIEKVTGISLHSFNNVKTVLTTHKQKIDWYLGQGIPILSQLPEKYDLVTDVFGCYFYTPFKVELIRAVHRVLSPGGRAYLYSGGNNYVEIDNTLVHLEQHLQDTYPDTFKFCCKIQRIFIITKNSQRCPIQNFDLVSSKYQPATSKDLSYEEAIVGNILYPYEIKLKKGDSSRKLRTLDCEQPLKRAKHQD